MAKTAQCRPEGFRANREGAEIRGQFSVWTNPHYSGPSTFPWERRRPELGWGPREAAWPDMGLQAAGAR
jgi:hypothetical protein